ncbi:MAG: preprotein translocase subunit SecG [Phycisphaerales bacterium]|nr:preprotein translocase subunit SecG [Phycisphaerales bacterium]
MLTLGLNGFLVGGLIVIFVIVCMILMLTVLIQRPSGGGLSGAFGSGAGSGQTAFGAKTGDALTIATIIMFVMYLGLAVGLNYATKPPSMVAPVAGPTGGENAPAGTGSPAGAPVPGTTEPGQSAPTPPSEQPAGTPAASPEQPAATPPVEQPAAPPASPPATNPAAPPR